MLTPAPDPALHLADQAPALIYILDLDTQSNVYVNGAVATLLGYTAEQVQAFGPALFADLLHPDDGATWVANVLPLYAAADDDTHIENEFRLRHARGEWRWFHVHERIYRRHPDGRPAQVLGVAQDMTARRQVERSQMDAMLANSFDGLTLFDRNGLLTYAAPAVARLLGYPPEWFPGKTIADLVHPDEIPAAVASFMDLVGRPGGSSFLLVRTHHADGSWRWIETGGSNLLDYPEVHAIVVNIRDVTERVQAETRLRYQAKLVANSFDAIIATDLAYNVQAWNPAAERIYGWTAAEVLGHPLNDFSGTMYVHASHGVALSAVLSYGSWQGEVWQQRKDGSTVEIQSSVSLLHDELGAVAGLVAINRDISARKAVERALADERALLALRVEERTAELQAANLELAATARLKDEFIAAVSQEFRTPMQAILGLAETLQAGLGGPVTAQQARSLGLLLESGNHLLGLIDGIIDFARSQGEQTVIELAPVAVPQLCEAAVRLVRAEAARKRQSVEVELDGGLPVLVADERVVKQILSNLLANAVKFTPEHGAIGLTVRGDRVAHLAHFTIWDTGIGIDPAHVERIFQPFVQLDAGADRPTGSTGLGLALCQRLARLHGGALAVVSNPGLGSRFTLTLPWVEAG